jgi:hypothetical protein
MNFDDVEKIAAAILYEGYILYPYRPTAIKNRQRWNFGTLYPRIYAEAQRPEEPYRLVAECLVEGDANSSLEVKVNFLQLVRQQRKFTHAPANDPGELSDPSLAWDEAVERTSEHSSLSMGMLAAGPLRFQLKIGSGNLSGIEEGQRLEAILTVIAEFLPTGAYKLHLELENVSPLPSGCMAKREEALPRSFVSAHVLLGVNGGSFVSLFDPPEIHRESPATCKNVGVFPVLAGEEPDRSMMLCSPIILYDYPKIAPESAGDFFDGTEMDEMLTLRVLTLTDEEKLEMRNGDPRARAILERTEGLTAESMLKAHGVVRGMREIRGES